MKFSKKALAVLSAVAMASVAVTSCKAASDDDENEMISGSNNKYSIDFTNSTTDTSRGYKATTFKHSGAVVKVTINDPAKCPNGVMGIIFDLSEEKVGETKERSFDIIGLRTNGATDGKIGAYVSRYEKITDINAGNFGAKEVSAFTGTKAEEKSFVGIDGKALEGTYDATAKTTTLYIAVKLEEVTKDVEYEYRIYATKEAIKISDSGVITKEDGSAFTMPTALATIPTKYTKVEQKQLAVYANVYKKDYKETGWTGASTGSLKGSWEYKGDYKEVSLED